MPRVVEDEVSAPAIPQLWRASLDESAVSVDWPASGEWLAAASARGTVYLFDSATGTSIHEWPAHRMGATGLAWHPHDGRFATAGQDGTARIWDAPRGSLVAEIPCGAEWVEHLAWSLDGKFLLTAAGRNLSLWSKDGELVREYPDHPNTIAAIAWGPGGEDFVSACYGQLQFWSPASSDPVHTFFWKGSMLAVAWSPDGRYLCHGNQDSTVHFWVVKTGKELQMWGYPMKVRELSWDRRSRYLATGGGASITVWDCSGKGPANTKPIVLDFHQGPITQLAWQRSGGALASGCDEGRLALWKPSKRKDPDAVAGLPAAISALRWSPDDNQIAAATEDGTVVVFGCPERPA